MRTENVSPWSGPRLPPELQTSLLHAKLMGNVPSSQCGRVGQAKVQASTSAADPSAAPPSVACDVEAASVAFEAASVTVGSPPSEVSALPQMLLDPPPPHA